MNPNRLFISARQYRRLHRKIPVSRYLLLSGIGIWLILYWLRSFLPTENETARYLLHFMQKFIGITLSLVLLAALLSAFIPWMAFKKRLSAPAFRLKLSVDDKKGILLQTAPVLQPFGGFLEAGFGWEEATSRPVPLTVQKEPHTPKGTVHLVAQPELPHVETYHLNEIRFYFIDFLHFFNFSVPVPRQLLVVNQPETGQAKNIAIRPLKTQTEKEKVYSNRKSAGDLYHFKHYETNDDIRRIVWPLYAKTGEFIVRNPEIQNQYASDALIYVSFRSDFPVAETPLSHRLLDFYKNVIFTAYKRLAEKEEYAVYLTTDQNTQAPFSQEKDIRQHIAACHWQQTTAVDQLPRPGQTSLVIVSSLDHADAVASLAGKHIHGMEFLFVPLSEAFEKLRKRDWIHWVFFHPGDNSLLPLRLRWWLYPLRKSIRANEHKISEILSSQTPLSAVHQG